MLILVYMKKKTIINPKIKFLRYKDSSKENISGMELDKYVKSLEDIMLKESRLASLFYDSSGKVKLFNSLEFKISGKNFNKCT